MAEPAEPIQKRRLLRMTVAHYRQPNVSEEEFHRWVTEQHAVRAAKLHAKNGIEGFSIYFTPRSFRDAAQGLNAKRGNPWIVRDYDAQVEFLFRDMDTFYKGAADPDFQALQAEEAPFVSGIHAEVSIGWVQTYVKDGKIVNVCDDGKADYPGFKELSVSP